MCFTKNAMQITSKDGQSRFNWSVLQRMLCDEEPRSRISLNIHRIIQNACLRQSVVVSRKPYCPTKIRVDNLQWVNTSCDIELSKLSSTSSSIIPMDVFCSWSSQEFCFRLPNAFAEKNQIHIYINCCSNPKFIAREIIFII